VPFQFEPGHGDVEHLADPDRLDRCVGDVAAAVRTPRGPVDEGLVGVLYLDEMLALCARLLTGFAPERGELRGWDSPP
jgi:hypothetical protein